jgi:Domain of unknown function (DUF3597)
MSIFGSIMDKIFHHKPDAAPAAGATRPAQVGYVPNSAQPAATPAAPAAPTPMSEVDVEAVLTSIASTYNHPVNWKYSIVDLMAILGIDNSLAQRRALAAELGYTGSTEDTATMNTWLHKEVMRKLAENGGKVPADLLG